MKQAIAYTIILFSLSGCATGKLPRWAPPVPKITKCTYSITHAKWRCKDNKGGKGFNRALNDPIMENAQAVSLDDYVKGQNWISEFSKEAQRRCR